MTGASTPAAALTSMQADRLAKDAFYWSTGRTPAPHNVHIALDVHGPFDAAWFEDACGWALGAHPALRHRFRLEDGAWIQEETPSAEVPFALTEPHPGEPLHEFLHRIACTRFELDRGLLFRAGLYPRGAEDQVLILAAEHLAADGWSLDLALDTVTDAYAGIRREPVPGRSFLGYARAEHERLDRYRPPAWVEALKGAAGLPFSEPPLARPVPPHRSALVHSASLPLDPGMRAELAGLVSGCPAPWSAVMVAAAHRAVAEIDGRDEVVTISPIGNRDAADLRTVGWYANMIPLRSTAAERASPDFLELVRDRWLEAIDPPSPPFWWVMERLFGHRSDRDPRMLWIWVDTIIPPDPPPPKRWPELTVAPRPAPMSTHALSLGIEFTVGTEKGELTAIARRDRMPSGDLERILRACASALAGLTTAAS
ncbi:condensation domain-containing protein [Actinomadura monticuli]|uniref:Condensation domain-containing protein n=1 Tax=Actinomadura monticuli TaxID=3097367 RepID=A0ABV4Q4J7_9ACTN